MSETEPVYWHYTTHKGLAGLLQDKAIRPATAGVDRRERPIVWFSTNQQWESTVIKAINSSDGTIVQLKNREDMLLHGIRLFRIGVFPQSAPFDWSQLKKMSRMNAAIVRGLVLSAIEIGADPDEWRGTFKAVNATEWVSLQEWDGHSWREVDAHDETSGREPETAIERKAEGGYRSGAKSGRHTAGREQK